MNKRDELRERLKGLSPAEREQVLKDIRARAKKKPADSSRIPRSNHRGEAPVSSDQRRMWFLHRLHPDSVAYLVPLGVRLRGSLQAEALRAALIALVARHEILRTVYPESEGVPTQRILAPPSTLDWSYRDVASEPQPEQAARAVIDAQIAVPFAIESELPFRVALARVGVDEHILLLLFHHIATDEWTTGVLVGELSELYAAACEGRDSLLPPMTLQYADYAIWQQKELQGEGFTKGREYWSGALTGAAGHIAWPTGQEAPAGVNPSERVEFQWSQELSGALATVAKQRGTSDFVVLHACLAAFLARFSGQEDMTLGVPVSMRQRPELQNLVGMLLNTVPVRTRVERGAGFEVWLDAVQSTWRASMPHHWIPLDEIARCVESGGPLFDTMFTFVPDHGVGEFAIGALRATPENVRGEVDAKCALAVSMSSRNGQFRGTFEYDAHRFEREVMVRLAEQFEAFTKRCIADPSRPIVQLDLLDAAGLGELRTWERGGEVWVSADAFPRLFERHVSEHGERDAVRFEGGVWSYRDLDQRANRLARALRREGVGQETAVGVCVQRSASLVAALLGVMKAGGAYVAFEPDLPAHRLSLMREDADVSVVVCDSASRELWVGTGVTCIEVESTTMAGDDSALDIELEATQLAYILYTSGTTGRPKGVMVPHRALSNICQIYAATLYGADCTPPDRCVLVKASYTFDLFVAELFPALTCGAAVAIAPPRAERDPERLVAALRQLGVTDLWGTPTSFRLLLESGSELRTLGLRGLYSGGEALTMQTCREIAEASGVEPWNLYGPTEMCCGQTGWEVDLEDGRTGVASIGGPIPNYEAGILDSQARRTSTGVDGEVVILGAGEARGYLGMARRTATSFVPAAIGERAGQRMYCTGDIGRWLPEGRIDYRGRRDDQLQVRGVRVELAEIEAHLEAAPGVAQAAVRAVGEVAGRADGVVAYIVATKRESPPEISALRDYLGRFLASAVVPSQYAFLDEMPTMASGKIDRHALPAIEAIGAISRDRQRPRNEAEETLAAIWREQLEVEEIGVFEDFFAIGGHSLVAVRVQHEISRRFDVHFPLALVFENSTIAAFAAQLEGLQRSATAIQPRANPDEAPVSSDQRRMWFLQQLDPGSSAYHVPLSVRFQGDLDVELLRRAVQALVERHEILRTTYFERGGEPWQHILPADTPAAWALVDASQSADPVAHATDLISEQLQYSFALDREIPFRVLVCRLSPQEHVLLLLFHHIAIDEWGMGLFVDELSRTYRALLAGQEMGLDPLQIQYADYAVWQRERLKGEEFEEGLAFWLDRLSDAQERIAWPFGTEPREGAQQAGVVRFAWSEATSSGLREFARHRGVSLFTALHAAFVALASRTSGQSDVTVGLPVTMRDRPELQNLVGFLLNTMPMRSRVDLALGFGDWLQQAQSDWREAMHHQWVPLEEIVRALNVRRTASGVPLFDTMFTFLPSGAVPPDLLEGGRTTVFEASASLTAKVALSVSMTESGGQLVGHVEYDVSRFDRRSMDGLATAFEHFVAQCLSRPEHPMVGHGLVHRAERTTLLELAQGAPVAVAPLAVHQLFERAAERDPQRVALTSADGNSLTYGALDRRAEAFASVLSREGVAAGGVVGLCMDRSFDLVAAMLGTLKAGCGYLPMEPAIPDSRLSYMADNAKVALVVTDAGAVERDLGAAPILVVAEDLFTWESTPRAAELVPEQPAYVLYTSGSTGKPKGVVVPHRALMSQVAWLVDEFEFTPDDVFYQKTPISFDASVWEFFVPLTIGARLCLGAPNAHRDVEHLVAKIAEESVSVLQLVPTQLAMLLTSPEFDGSRLGSLRQLFCGGEALDPALVRRFQQRFRAGLVNLYGPTEACINATSFDCTAGDEATAIYLGKPVANTRTYVLDGWALQQRPQATTGELCIAGDQLASGYVQRAGLTAERFLPDPFATNPGARMYRTGDATRRAGALLEYRGRFDFQVKMRGFRIELEEIESVVSTHPAVARAAVRIWANDAGAEMLVAYVLPVQGGETSDLVEHCAAVLPEYMVPSRFIPLTELPLSASGKIDRQALPAIGAMAATKENRQPPRTEAEKAVAEIWREQLEIEDIGVFEDFFAVGGHSLVAVRVQHEISRRFDVQFPLALFFENPTIAAIAARLERLDRTATAIRLRPGEPRGGLIGRHEYGDEATLSSHQRRMWFLQTLHPDTIAYQVPLPVRISGDLQPEAMQAALQQLTARHEILRTIYPERDGEPIQKILPAPQAVSWRSENMAGAENPASAALDFVMQQVREPFALRTEISLRAAHVELGPRDHVLLLLFHHIAIDEWSTNVLIDELSELYSAQVEHREHDLPELTLQYADYAIWQTERLESGDTSGVDFWSKHLEGAPPGLEWPVQHEPSTQHHGALPIDFQIEPTTSDALRALARKHKVSEFVALYAVFSGYLARITGQRDLVVGVPVTMRDRQELQSLVGFVLNTLPLRSRVAPNVDFASWIASVQSTWLQTLPHHEVPLDAIARRVQSESRSGGVSPFDTMFSFVPGGREPTSFAGLEMSDFALSGPLQAKVALNVSMSSGVDGFEGVFEYDTALFRRTAIEALVRGFERFLASCVECPERPMIAHPVSSDEHQSLAREWSTGASLDTPSMSVHQLFEQQARADGARTALIHADGNWSYARLNHAANVIARELRELGVGPEVVVGVSLERSPLLLASLLGVLKAGGAYLALQPDLPAERLEYMATDSAAQLVLCDGSGQHASSWKTPVVRVDAIEIDREAEDLGLDIDPESLAYILYTSGSTGRPKGVEMRHGPVTKLVAAVQNRGLCEPDDVVLWKTPYGFDVSVSELFNTLAVGACLVVSAPGTERDPEAIVRAIQQHGVTSIRLVPTALEMLVDAPSFSACTSVRRVIAAGEALTGLVARTYFALSDGDLFNLLGPTEACVYATFLQCEPDDDAALVGVGEPLDNYRTYVLDEALEPVSPTVRGELYIGGDGLARGYRAMASRTALSFVPDPHTNEPGARMYRTGDLVWWNERGGLEYVGRADNQLQVRGIRVELLEVETLLAAVAGVRSAAVRAVNESSGRADALIAYLVFEEGRERTPAELRSELKRNLAEAVIPTRFVKLEAMPRTASGKIDRNALPAIEAIGAISRERQRPRNEAEETLAAIWREHLEVEEIGVFEDFFAIGGHSLVAVRVQHEISRRFDVHLPLALLFENSTIAALAAQLDGLQRSATAIQRRPNPEEAPVSSDQRRMWFLQQLDPGSSAYHVPLAVRFAGDLDLDALRRAVQGLIDRHEILRTTYFEREGEPWQRILPVGTSATWTFLDASQSADPVAHATELISERLQNSFALDREIPLRLLVCPLSPQEHVLLLLFHHIAIDEWGMGLFVDELSRTYRALVADEEVDLAPLQIQYADYAVWQRERLDGVEFKEGLAFWLDRLSGAQEHIAWPFGTEPREGAQQADIVEFAWSEETSSGLREFARSGGISLFTALHAVFVALVSRISGQSDVTVGLPVTMRDRPELQYLIGFLLNTVPMRSRVDLADGFAAWLQRAHSDWRDAMPHQWVPLEELVRALNVRRSVSGVPLFDTIFTFLPSGAVPSDLFEGGQTTAFDISTNLTAKVGLSVSMTESGGQLVGHIEYDVSRFDRQSMLGLARAFESFVGQCQRQPEHPMLAHELVRDDERATLRELAQGAHLPVAPLAVHQLFERAASRDPQRVALKGADGTSLTYGALDRRADAFASILRQQGVGVGQLVGLCMGRSFDLVAAILGTLKAGCGYLPMEPAIPDSRLSYMADNAKVALVMADAGAGARDLGSAPVLFVGDHPFSGKSTPPATELVPEQPAYVLYTSGSTGRPKGVVVPHSALMSQVAWLVAEFGFTPDDVFFQKTPISFDASVWEFFVPLTIGACLCLGAPDAHRDVEHLITTIAAESVSVLQLVPTQLAMLLTSSEFDGRRLGSLRQVFCGGEALDPALVRRFQKRFNAGLVNLYGPTEACINATSFDCTASGEDASVCLGKPVANTRAYVLDGWSLQQRPQATTGELCIGGEQLASGYIHQAGLTAERFLPDPFATTPGARMYRTGDATRRAGALLAYRGRFDFQVKMRGFRIELEEIESVVCAHSGVARAAVRVWANDAGAEMLVAYVLPVQGGEISDLVEHCAAVLPEYMVPGRFIRLNELPLSASGKIDREALPEPNAEYGRDKVMPRTEMEEAVAKLWREQLGIAEIGVHEEFFSIGGHSLLAVQLRQRMTDSFGKTVPLSLFFGVGTIASIARHLEAGHEDTAHLSAIVELQKGAAGSETPLVLIHPIGGALFGYRALVDALPAEQRIIGVQSPGLTGDDIPSSIDEMAVLYARQLAASLPEGRCRLVGWSLGGVIAFATVSELEALGIVVEHLVLLDSYAPGGVPTEAPRSDFQAFAADLGATLGASPQELHAIGEKLFAEAEHDPIASLCDVISARTPAGVKIDAELLSRLFEVHRRHGAAYRNYAPLTGSSIPVTLVTATRGEAARDRGWGKWLDTDVEIVALDVDHYSLLLPPASDRIASIVLGVARASA